MSEFTVLDSSDNADVDTWFDSYVKEQEAKEAEIGDVLQGMATQNVKHTVMFSTSEYTYINKRLNPVMANLFESTNKILDTMFPLEKQRFDDFGLTSIFTLPVKMPNGVSDEALKDYVELITEYSHDIMLLILRRDVITTIDAFITNLENYSKMNPPFRFRFLDVIIVFSKETTNSKFLFI